MFIAGLAGIEIFATGGIGGVHRGAEETFDISADLVELSRTRVAVVCAGAKSILDIGKTLEFLETQGVAVVGYRTDEFPAFYARSSGFKLEHRCDGLHDLARTIRLQRDIGPGGLLIANPIPHDHALEEARSRRASPKPSRKPKRKAWARRRRRRSSEAGGRTHRRAKPRGQYRAHQEQRHARRADGGRAHEVINAEPSLRPGPNDVRARSSTSRRFFSDKWSDENRAAPACRRILASPQRMVAKAKATSAPAVTSIS